MAKKCAIIVQIDSGVLKIQYMYSQMAKFHGSTFLVTLRVTKMPRGCYEETAAMEFSLNAGAFPRKLRHIM